MQEKDTIESPEKFPVEHKLSKFKKNLLKIKRRILSRHLKAARFVLFASILIIIGTLGVVIFNFAKTTSIGRYAHMARLFVKPPENVLKELDGHTNILILGKAGEGYTAPDLTDTIMVASINKNNDKITLVSLPRDIWIPSLRAKLNSAYYWGNKKQEDGGIILAKSTVEEIVGLPIHYAVVIDFNGFVDLIDALGGVDVSITKTFEDKRYPIAGRENDECGGDPEYSCRYETLTFYEGVEHMSGERALKYVRSRHSEDKQEGTDLARSERQQKVIQAIRAKALSKKVLLSPKTISAVYKAGMAMIETDLDEDSLVLLSRLGYDARNNVSNYVLPEEFLVNPPISSKYDRQYVFVPKNESWREVQVWIQVKI